MPILKKIDCVLVSIDGPQGVHDITGKRLVKELLEDIQLLKKHGVNVSTSTVLTRQTIENLEYLFRISEEYNLQLAFHPFSYLKFLSLAKTKTCDLAPSIDEFKKAIKRIIEAKRNGVLIINSLPYLNLILDGNYPGFESRCLAGMRYCYIDTNGDVYPCSPMTGRMPVYNSTKIGFMEAFKRMPNFSCGNGCIFSCYLEYNFVFSLYWKSLLNLYKLSGKNKSKVI